MAETKSKQAEQTQTTETPETETPGAETSNYQADRDAILEATQQFVRSVLRAGIHMAIAPVNLLPPEPREHFISAGREFTRGLTTLAHELADDFEKMVVEVKEEVKEDEVTE
jgi:hypothetical protein